VIEFRALDPSHTELILTHRGTSESTAGTDA
jgi:hypothetical protein